MHEIERPARVIRLPLPPQARLRSALRRLNAALDEQRIAIACWRAALADLRSATAGIGKSIMICNETLDGIHRQAMAAGAAATEAERNADLLVEVVAARVPVASEGGGIQARLVPGPS